MPNIFQPFGGSPKNRYLGSLQPSLGSSPVPSSLPSPTIVKPQTTPSTTGGTAPTPTPSPAKQQYINNVTNPQTNNAPAAPTTQNTPSPNGTANGYVAPPDPNQNYKSAYDSYIASLQPNSDETSASQYLNSLISGQKQQDFDISHRPGATSSFLGAEQERADAESNRNIDSATNAYNALNSNRTSNQNAAKARVDYESSLLPKPGSNIQSVSPGSTLFDTNTGKSIYTAPTTASQNGTGTADIGGTYVPGENPTVDGYIAAINGKQATLAQVPAAYKGLVAQGLSSTGQASDLKSDALTSAQQLLSTFDSSSGVLGTPLGGARQAVGGTSVLPIIPGTQAADFVKNIDNLKSLLSLDNVRYLKGQGAVSDAERQLLADSATQLSRTQSEGQFKKTLQGIIDTLGKAQATANKSGSSQGITPSGISYTVTQ